MRVQKNQFFFGLGLTRAGLSVPDSGMLISLADALDTSVSILLGETVQEPGLNESEEVPREERQSVIYLLRYV